MAPNTKNYWFVLGREPQIAAAEIDAVLNLKKYDYSPPILKIAAKIEPPKLIKHLGGTIKIAEELSGSIDEAGLKKIIIDELKKVKGKINFGLSFYGASEINLKQIKILGLEIKKGLKNNGYSVRYVENKEAALSSVTVEKNGLTNRGREFLISPLFKEGVEGCQHYSLAQTKAVQPFEEFSARDFGRPGRDNLSGMLPPKLAMILINLAQTPLNSTLLDPFCGSGTILSEAVLLGYKNLIGSDLSEKAISDSKKNIEWIAQKFKILNDKFQIKYQISNVENLSRIIAPSSVDAIVTEPYLGKPLRGQETKQELISQTKELKNLYLQAFQQFYQILKPKGKIVFIIPRFKYIGQWITINCKNEIEKIGFKALPARIATQSVAGGGPFFENHLPLVYSRPNQRVAREIWRFIKR